MNDMPKENNSNNEKDDKNPILATLEAMQRLKNKNLELETRVENLEKAFEMAFKNGATSLQEFLTKLDENSSSEDDTNESETKEENDTQENEDNEENENGKN